VLEAGGPARVQSFAGATRPIAREAQSLGIRASVGCPIVVAGRIWGVIAASTMREAPFAPETESRIADFTELVATAIANAEARAELLTSRAVSSWPPTRRVGLSSATCTTAHSSARPHPTVEGCRHGPELSVTDESRPDDRVPQTWNGTLVTMTFRSGASERRSLAAVSS
jgi:hypothetical protein